MLRKKSEDGHKDSPVGKSKGLLYCPTVLTPALPLESCSGITHPIYRSAELFCCGWFLNSSFWLLQTEQRGSREASKQLCTHS